MSPERSLSSALYVGDVVHRRHEPFFHAFQYRLFQLFLDLDELDEVFQGRWFWSTSRTALARFRRTDHLGDPSRPLKECVQDLVEQRLGRRPDGPVRLLTHLRYFGYVMNPVSFYYCQAAGGALDAVVAEVHNTPWGERHCYVLDARNCEDGVLRAEHAKEFHVSPFQPMDVSYRWRLTPPSERLAITIENVRQSRTVFDATLSLRRRPISGMSLARCLALHPWMTGKITAAIYWQALRLWWLGARFHPHPGSKPIPTATNS